MTETGPAAGDDDRQLHRHWGSTLFNQVWRLVEQGDRTADQDALLVHQAHASLYHWLQGGTPNHAARGEWQCSRVYCVVGRPEPALYHARRVLEICQRHGIGDWDLAFAYEALARAHRLAGDHEQARHWLAQARQAADAIAEDEDRELLLADLATIRLPDA